jgi:hypothetical protein
MDLFQLSEREICPWALREGVILRRIDSLDACTSTSQSRARNANGPVPLPQDRTVNRSGSERQAV